MEVNFTLGAITCKLLLEDEIIQMQKKKKGMVTMLKSSKAETCRGPSAQHRHDRGRSPVKCPATAREEKRGCPLQLWKNAVVTRFIHLITGLEMSAYVGSLRHG